jgi:hypothetical protein
VHIVARPAFHAFVLLAPAGLIAAAVVFAARGGWWSAAFCAVAAATPASLIPRERALRLQGRGQGRLYGELRGAVVANVPAGQTRTLRRYGDSIFYTVGRRPGRFGTEHVLIQRFDEADLPNFGDLLTGDLERGALVCTAFHLHPWYPAVSREVHGTTVTFAGHDLQIEPVAPSAGAADAGARRLGRRTGLGQADPAELREIVHALTHADAITGGPETKPSL